MSAESCCDAALELSSLNERTNCAPEVIRLSSDLEQRGRKYHGHHPQRRRNDLLVSLGFLELANATDFAANVWNQNPPPIISVVFMVVGATAALVIFAFAARDMPKSWRNGRLLRHERGKLNAMLGSLQASEMEDEPRLARRTMKDLRTSINLNTRELGNELLDRFVMGLGLGFGAVTLAAGTYLAIGGANKHIYDASNTLTSYMSNVPATIYGLVNAAWCIYGWRRAQSHIRAVRHGLPHEPWEGKVDIAAAIQHREAHVKAHAIINGFSGILGGVGGLMTATAYIHPQAVWGYLLLIPCVMAAIFANVVWRRKINYDRDIEEPKPLGAYDLLNHAGYALVTEALVSDLNPSRRRLPWPFHRNAAPVEEDGKQRLLAFLIEYARLTTQILEQRSPRIKTTVRVSKQVEDGQALQPEDATPLVRESALPTSGSERWNEMLSQYEILQSDRRKPTQAQDLTRGLLEVLTDLNAIPDFCARLANNSTTALMIETSAQCKGSVTHVDVKVQLSHEKRRGASSEDVLKVACETLATEGLIAAKSRARYALELAGSYLQFQDA